MKLILTCLLLCVNMVALSQEISGHRILNVTLDTYSPSQLAINRGRLIWADVDPNTLTRSLKYFSGSEVVRLDSGLQSVRASIDGDYVAWNTPSGQIKSYNVRTWTTALIGPSYYPEAIQPVSVANGRAAYARSAVGSGTEIVLHNLATGSDTMFRAGAWNTSPSVHHGQLAWVTADLESPTAPSEIFFHDGVTTRNISDAGGAFRCDSPIVRDGQVTWLESSLGSRRVRVFNGDSTIVLLQVPVTGPARISGYDMSAGVTVASRTDTATNTSTIFIYLSNTGVVASLQDSQRVSSLHIDNGLVCWASGTGSQKHLTVHQLQDGSTEILGAADDPVVDDLQIAWTFGDAVDLRVPVRYEQFTNDGQNGWPQTRFKAIDEDRLLWGNFEQSLTARLFFSNGGTVNRLTDSTLYKDFIMANEGYAIWREDFTSLWLYDGSNPPVRIIDSLQCENMYVAGGSIGFHGFRISSGNNINQAWLYRIGTSTLTQLTNDVSPTVLNGITLVDGNTACWYRFDGAEDMFMYYDGATAVRLSDSTIDNEFSYRGGRIVWSERRNGVMQVMMYATASGTTSQVTNGTVDATGPITDGSVIAWYEGPPTDSYLCYYVMSTGSKTKITRLAPSVARWLWLSNGRIAWSQDNEVHVYDGTTTSRLTSAGSFRPSVEPYVDNERVAWKSQSPVTPEYGDIYRGMLQPLVAFDAANVSGLAPLTVSLYNRSWQATRSSLWDFGDGMTSTEADPVHTYPLPGVYSVTLTATGPFGSSTEQKVRLVRVLSSTSVQEPGPDHPMEFSLAQCYPNPFNPATTIGFEVGAVGFVSLKVFDVLGREVATLVNEVKGPGSYIVPWDASGVASGVYMYRIEAASSGRRFVHAKRMMVLR